MNWLTPLAGLYLSLAVLPPLILLYFLKLRRRRQSVSSTLLWKKAVEDLQANAPFQRLQKSLLLFLQLLALSLLAVSIMQPQLHAGRQSGGKTVILIDNSASMTSRNVSSENADATRLDEAKRRAKERVEAIYSGGLFATSFDETMVVSFSNRAEVVSRFTTSKQQLLNAIDRIQPTHGETHIADALKLARAYTTNIVDDMGEARPSMNPPALELYSDGRIRDLADQVLRGERLNFHAIGSPDADNVAIVNLSVERPFDRPNAVEIFVALLNYNPNPVTCDIQLSINNRARSIEETTIVAAEYDSELRQLRPGRANVVFTPFEQPRGAVLEVANLRDDDLASDNVAQVVVPPPSRLSIALVVENSNRSIVRRVLEGMNLERLEIISPAHYELLAEQQGLDVYDVIVLDRYSPKLLPNGRYLSFGPTPPVEGLNEFGTVSGQIILDVMTDHPSLRYVNYDNICISEFKLIQPDSDVQVLMEGSRGPAILGISRGPLQLIHCTFDPLDSNWPFQRSFVTFLFNAIDYLGHAGEALTSQGLKPGEALAVRLPASATDIRLLVPDKAEASKVEVSDPTQFAWGPIRLTGIHALSWRTPESDQEYSKATAVNLFSEIEGRIDVNRVIEVGQDEFESQNVNEAAYTPMWPWAVGACLALLMLEGWIYHRKMMI